jgi:hypothetical protein
MMHFVGVVDLVELDYFDFAEVDCYDLAEVDCFDFADFRIDFEIGSVDFDLIDFVEFVAADFVGFAFEAVKFEVIIAVFVTFIVDFASKVFDMILICSMTHVITKNVEIID